MQIFSVFSALLLKSSLCLFVINDYHPTAEPSGTLAVLFIIIVSLSLCQKTVPVNVPVPVE